MRTSTSPHEVEHLRKRVALYLLVMLLVDLGAWVSDVLSPMVVEGLQTPELPLPAYALRLAVTPFLVVSWAVARFATPGRSALILFEAAVTLALVLAYAGIGAVYMPEYGPALGLFGLVMLLFVRASLVPSPVVRTVVIGALSAGVFLSIVDDELEAIGPVMRDGLTFMSVVVVIVTAVNSHVIYGLQREVRKALRLGQYTLEEKLGEGGMGAVFRARHAMLRRQAAIKLIKPQLSGGAMRRSEARERFDREAQATADLKSPHTIQLYDFGIAAEGAFYYVMELLDGLDLETAVARFGPMPPERVAFLLRQACDSLEEAHAAGLVHRDIKPANIFLCHYGLHHDFVKILDFGLVTLGAEAMDAKLAHDNAAVGTPAYVAPEMVSADHLVDSRSDLYALGCVAYWLLTASPPFVRESAVATILAHVNEEPVPPSNACEIEVPPALDALVLNCLAKWPDDRPASAAELARRLDAIPIEPRWTQERAQRWWQTHKPERPKLDADSRVASQVTKSLV